MRTDLSHLPPSTPDEIRAMTRRAGLELPEELMQQFTAAWPAFEAMVRRIPRDLDRAAEPTHSYRPLRIVRGLMRALPAQRACSGVSCRPCASY
jgi:hypothetical protein